MLLLNIKHPQLFFTNLNYIRRQLVEILHFYWIRESFCVEENEYCINNSDIAFYGNDDKNVL